METRRFTMRRTHHGPVVAEKDGKLITLRMAKFESDGWLRQWYDMTKANSLAALKRAIAPLNMLFGTLCMPTVRATRSTSTTVRFRDVTRGSIGPSLLTAVILRPNGRVITRWQELPQLTNPKTGWMQNCNTTPFLLTSEGNPDPKNYPKYMVQESDNLRGAPFPDRYFRPRRSSRLRNGAAWHSTLIS